MPWMNKWEAERLVGRSSRTLREWKKRGWLKTGLRDRESVYDQATLLIAARKAEAARTNHRAVAGPGRGKKATWTTGCAAEKYNMQTLF